MKLASRAEVASRWMEGEHDRLWLGWRRLVRSSRDDSLQFTFHSAARHWPLGAAKNWHARLEQSNETNASSQCEDSAPRCCPKAI